MRAWLSLLNLMTVAGCLGIACTGKLNPTGDFPVGGGGAGSAGSTSGPAVTSSTTKAPAETTAGSGGAGAAEGAGAAGGTGGAGCNGWSGDDADGDGFTIADGDCDDCNPLVNPNAIEIVLPRGEGGEAPEPVDDDCDGIVDNLPEPCDGDLALMDEDPLSAAKAIELCKMSKGPGDWGVVSATWVLVDGSPPPSEPEKLANFHLGHGILPAFGNFVTPKGGKALLALSSGTARQVNDPDYRPPDGFDKGYESDFPPGFPKTPKGCSEVIPARPHDATAVELVIRVPSNVYGFSFNVNFNTYDWPVVCDHYNDFFIALLSPAPPNRIDGHLLFDANENAMSVNNAFIDVCTCEGGPPCQIGQKTFACSRGTTELSGTGFEGHAATSWLVTSAPVKPNQEIKIRFGAYDAGDYALDSTGLVDNWRWITKPGVVVQTRPDAPALH